MPRAVSNKLTDAVIRRIGVPTKVTEVRDHIVTGLLIRIHPTAAGNVTRNWKLIEKTADGKRRPVTLGSFPELDCAAARAAARELRGEIVTGETEMLSAAQDVSLHAFTEQWAEDVTATGKLKTAHKIARAVRGAFPDVKVREITTAMVEGWQTDIAKRTSASNANKLVPYLTGVLNAARRAGIIDKNPAQLGKRGQMDKLPERFKPARYFTPEEWAAMDATLDASVPDWFADLCRVAIGSGARLGELLALEWRNVDLDRGTVTFEAATTKDSEPRTVPISRGALRVLKAHSKRHGTDGKVFHDGHNGAVSSRLMDRALDAAGVEKITADGTVSFKTFRTTFASWVVQRTNNLLVVSKLLGHSGIALTAKHYAHLADGDEAAAVATLD